MGATTVIYLAAPLFSDAERGWNASLADRLRRDLSMATVLLPQEFCRAHEAATSAGSGTGRAGRPDFSAIFADCRRFLDQADYVVAVLDGPDPDSGTAWEMGYAHARGKIIIGLRTDWRPAEDGAANCMLRRSCAAVCGNVDDLVRHLVGWIR
jgi:nucleoside 2-deoxyribosyltransferase